MGFFSKKKAGAAVSPEELQPQPLTSEEKEELWRLQQEREKSELGPISSRYFPHYKIISGSKY